MRPRIIMLAVVALALLGRPAAADELQKLTIAFAGKGMSFLLQYIAIGAGFYKQEGIDPESVDVSSGTRQAAAVMGGSAEITQVGFAHTMHAVGRGGQLVGICTGVRRLSDRAGALQRRDQAAGHHRHHVDRREDQAGEGRAYRHHLARLQHRRVHAHHHAGARHGPVARTCSCSRSVSARRWWRRCRRAHRRLRLHVAVHQHRGQPRHRPDRSPTR